MKVFYPACFYTINDAQQPLYHRYSSQYMVCRDMPCSSEQEAMDWAEIHAPILSVPAHQEITKVEGGYVEVTRHDSGSVTESRAVSREEHDYWNDADARLAEQRGEQAAEAAAERYFEDLGWVAAAAQDERDARLAPNDPQNK